jgi:alkanesulfonate monooxygenase SsuD/methylene tetrahydromethanopterin reductase-like flavin-dependent oxidoreductase (luciferase family)
MLGGMRTGVIVLQVEPWSTLHEIFGVLDRSPVSVAYVADHLSHPRLAGRWLADGPTVLAAAATATTRVDLGTLVSSTAFRSPMTIARQAATLADVAAGRFVLGLGSGSPHDVAVDSPPGHPDPVGATLSTRYADTVAALHDLWAGEEFGGGELVGFAHAVTTPTAPGSERPFLLLAGHGPRSWRLVASCADGWSSYGGPQSVQLPPDEFWALCAEQSRHVDEHCARVDRDPARLRRSLLLGYGTVQPLASVSAYVESAERAREAGFEEVVVYWPDREGSDFAAEPDVLLEGLERVAAL